MAPDTYRFIGYNTLPYQDWLDKKLMQYVAQRNQFGEGGYADPWMTQLMANGSPLGSTASLNQAVQGIGGYGAIGFDPNNVWNSAVADYARTGYGLSRDASGNVIEPMFNTATEGSDLGKRLGLPGGLSFGGSEGEGLGELASLIEMGALSYGGAAAAGATSGTAGASTTAGFGEAGYAGAGGGAGAATGSGAGYDFGMTGNEGSGLTAANGQPVAGISGSQGSGNLAGSAGNDTLSGSPSGGSMGEDTGAGFDFGLTGNEGAASSGFDWGSLLNTASQYKGLIGTALGALLGGSSGGSKPAGTTTSTQDVPAWLLPYVQGNLDLGTLVRNGLLTSPSATRAATPGYLDTINGKYLDPATNPYLDATYKHAAGLVGADVDSRFAKAGRYGSGAHQGVLQEGLNNLATNIYGGNYQQERTRQNAAITGAPTFDAGASTAAFAPLTGYASLFPNSRSTTTPYFTNQLGGILSGALAGGAIASKI